MSLMLRQATTCAVVSPYCTKTTCCCGGRLGRTKLTASEPREFVLTGNRFAMNIISDQVYSLAGDGGWLCYMSRNHRMMLQTASALRI